MIKRPPNFTYNTTRNAHPIYVGRHRASPKVPHSVRNYISYSFVHFPCDAYQEYSREKGK